MRVMIGAISTLSWTAFGPMAQHAGAAEPHKIGPNYYVTEYSSHGDWRVWLAEKPDKTECFATIPSLGSDVRHTDVFMATYTGALQIVISRPWRTGSRIAWQLEGKHWPADERGIKLDLQEKFYRPIDVELPSLLKMDGLEVHALVVSYKYPTIGEGRSEIQASFNLTGTTATAQSLKDCLKKHTDFE